MTVIKQGDARQKITLWQNSAVARSDISERDLNAAEADDATRDSPETEDPTTIFLEKLEKAEADIAAAFERGVAEGHEKAALEFEDDNEKSLTLLEEQLALAQENLQASLAKMESMATLIAVSAVEKMIDLPDIHHHILVNIIEEQMQRVGRQSLLNIRVSRLDFPDTAQLGELASRLGLTADQVAAPNELERGHCEMVLTVGSIEIGLQQQWKKIQSALLDMLAADDSDYR